MRDTAVVEFLFIIFCTLMCGGLVACGWKVFARWSWGLFFAVSTIAFLFMLIAYSWLEVTGTTHIREFFRFAL